MSNNQKPQRPATPVGAGKPTRGEALRARLEKAAADKGVNVTIPQDLSGLSSADGRRRALESTGGDVAEQLAKKYGVDADSAKVLETAKSLATEEGRREAMRELGVHMSGKLAEKYGVSDNEASKLLESSRALRTREGRQSVLAEHGADIETEKLMSRLHDRGLNIDDRRALVNSLLKNDKVTGTLKKAGRGLVIGAIILLVALAVFLVGAVALLTWLFQSGGGDASALVDVISTRPAVAWFAAPGAPA